MQGVLAVDVATAAIAILPLFFVAIPQPERRVRATDGGENSFWEDFREGFVYLRSWPGILALGIMATLINFLLTPASALTPLLVIEHFGGGAIELGWIEAAFAAGVIGGGILLGVWGGFRRRILTCVIAIVGIGVGMAVMGFVPADGLYLGLAGMAFAGLMMPFANGSLGAIFQAVIDPAMQGRAMTLIGSLAMAMSPLGLIIAGPLADVIGVQAWFVIGGVGCALMGLWGLSSKVIMQIEENGGPGKLGKPAAADPAAIEAT
jgi:DHA3 family macrolide efflux protein-like MFS transporter